MDAEGKFLKVTWVRVKKRSGVKSQVRCRLVSEELGC